MSKEKLPLHIRWLIRRDMTDVMFIEKHQFSDHWTEDEFVRNLRMRDTIGMVIDDQCVILGYVFYRLRKTKLELLKLAVCPHHRRIGLGTKLLQRMADKLSSHRRTRMTIRVDERNMAALNFLKHFGFEAIRVDRGDAYDEIVMRYRHKAAASATLNLERVFDPDRQPGEK